MIDEEKDHIDNHQGTIEGIEIRLGAEKDAVLTHSILNDAEYRSDHDEAGTDVKDHEITLPWQVCGLRTCSRCSDDAHVEYSCNNDEESEKEYLDAQPSKNDILPELGPIL